LYIKPLFSINEQFSIDSFLDWEGLHCNFSSTFTSPPICVPFSAFIKNAEASDMLIDLSCVHAKYQLSSFNIVGAIKERGRKLATINKILEVF